MDIKIKGLKETKKQLKGISKNIDKIPKKQNVKLPILLNDRFMTIHTKFTSFKAMEKAFEKETGEKLTEKILGTKMWDNFVSKNSNLNNWKELLTKAGVEYYSKQINDIL